MKKKSNKIIFFLLFIFSFSFMPCYGKIISVESHLTNQNNSIIIIALINIILLIIIAAAVILLFVKINNTNKKLNYYLDSILKNTDINIQTNKKLTNISNNCNSLISGLKKIYIKTGFTKPRLIISICLFISLILTIIFSTALQYNGIQLSEEIWIYGSTAWGFITFILLMVLLSIIFPKFGIWTGCIFLWSLINVIINSKGITLGGVPAAFLSLIVFFLAPYLCKKLCKDSNTDTDEENTTKDRPTIYNNLKNFIIPSAIAISIIIVICIQMSYSDMVLVLFDREIIEARILWLLISAILGLTEIILLFIKPSSINNCNSTASNIHNDKNKSAAESEDTAKALYTIKKAQESGGNFKWIAKNIAITYYEMKKSLSHLPLTSRQLFFATALSGSASYLKSGELTVQDISDAVEYAENGYISLGCCFIRCEKLCGSYQSEELIYLIMQLEALFFGVDCNIDEKNIVYSVLGQQSSIADTVEQTLNEGEKCDIYPEIRSNVYSHTCKEEFISKVLNFKGHIYDNGHIY